MGLTVGMSDHLSVLMVWSLALVGSSMSGLFSMASHTGGSPGSLRVSYFIFLVSSRGGMLSLTYCGPRLFLSHSLSSVRGRNMNLVVINALQCES